MAARAGDQGVSRRARLARMLATRSDTLMLLSATPHDGSARSFASLMSLLDPTAISDPDDYTPDDFQHKGLVVRRFKKDIRNQVPEHFPECDHAPHRARERGGRGRVSSAPRNSVHVRAAITAPENSRSFSAWACRQPCSRAPPPRSSPRSIVDGRGDWDGGLELRRHNVNHIAVGDLSTPLAPLIQQTDLEDVMSHPLYLSGNDRRSGTYGSGAKSNNIDYILLSPTLWATVSAVGVERRGVWAPRTFPHFPEIGSAVEAASDHAAVWVDLP